MVTIPDVEWEILSRVPAKSLAKWKTGCKRWYALFRDPKFVEKNLASKAAVRESLLLINSGVYSIGDDLHGIHNSVGPSIEFTGKLGLRNDSKALKIYKIFHCDGLILCTTMCVTRRLVVWNPCTGQTRWIKPRTRYRWEDHYALGYANTKSSSSSSCHSYKILRSCRYRNNDQKVEMYEFEVYEFSSDSWRVLDYSTCDYYDIFCYGMSLKGNTYWVAGDEGTGLFMLKFDFTTERFGRLPLPFQCFDIEDTAVALSVVTEEKLSVLQQDFSSISYEMKIWVTNKIDEETKDLSWRSDLVLVVDFGRFNLPSYASASSFLLDEENKVAVCCNTDYDDRSRIFIVGKDMYQQVYEEDVAKIFQLSQLLNYVPSLVHIQKKYTQKAKENKTKEIRGGR